MSVKASRFTLASLAIVVALVGSFVGSVWGAAIYAEKVDALRQAQADHEIRLRLVEKQVDGMSSDIRWIRMHIERVAKANGVLLDVQN